MFKKVVSNYLPIFFVNSLNTLLPEQLKKYYDKVNDIVFVPIKVHFLVNNKKFVLAIIVYCSEY